MTENRPRPLASVPTRGPGDAGNPLVEMADELRLVNEAAAGAAERLGDAAERLRGESGGDFRSELLADLGASLVERMDEIRSEAERLSRTLARATKLASREDNAFAGEDRPVPSPRPAGAEAEQVPELFKPAEARNGGDRPEPAQEADPAPAAPSPDPRRSPGQRTPEGVRLAATQMAVAGSSRSEIERCLRIQFGVRDADAALDEIFGNRASEVG